MNCSVERVVELSADADVIVPLMHRLEQETIGNTGAHLIQQFGVGLEGVDIPAATSKGIMVCNVPADVTLNADSTAEHAVFLMMGAARRVGECRDAFQDGLWGGPVGQALSGGTALIVGLGRVGTALADKLIGLGMRVSAIRRSPAASDRGAGGTIQMGTPDDLDEMARDADFIISTVGLNDETMGLFDAEFFETMRTSAYFINVSRGAVVREESLIQALSTNAIAGAGLDVFTKEPLAPSSALLGMKTVFATPHVGGVTRQNFAEMGKVVAENIRLTAEGKEPLYCANLKELAERYSGSQKS